MDFRNTFSNIFRIPTLFKKEFCGYPFYFLDNNSFQVLGGP